MRAYAKKAFELAAVDADGNSYREVLQGLRDRTADSKQIAKYEAELACPEMPAELVYLWNAFLRLSARRTVGFSANPISWSEIDAFARYTGTRLTPWEVKILEDLDDLYRAAQAPQGES